LAPDNHTIVWHGKVDCHFVDLRSHKNLGRIAHTSGQEDIVASWSVDSSKVAIVMYYGSKLCCLQIFRKTSKGVFVEVPFDEPQPMEMYQKAHGELPFQYDGSTAPEDAVGQWEAKDTVHLVAGEAHLNGPHLFVTFDVQITNKKAVIRNIQMHDLMPDDQAEKFLNSLGAHH